MKKVESKELEDIPVGSYGKLPVNPLLKRNLRS
jgi:hypothetical protein